MINGGTKHEYLAPKNNGMNIYSIKLILLKERTKCICSQVGQLPIDQTGWGVWKIPPKRLEDLKNHPNGLGEIQKGWWVSMEYHKILLIVVSCDIQIS